MADKFSLEQLRDDKLEIILSLDDRELAIYLDNLVQRFYPHARDYSLERYQELCDQYINSFHLERIYRQSEELQEGFVPVYTDTGMIQELTNKLYALPVSIKN